MTMNPKKHQGRFGRAVMVGAAGVCALAGAANAGVDVVAQITPPVLDRWMYPFGPTGARAFASTFTTIGSSITGFDDRDAEYLLGFETAGAIPTGYPADAYRVRSVVVTAYITVQDGATGIVFDPTSDPAASYLPAGHAARIDDADKGRPVELFACGYRGNSNLTGEPWGPLNFTQNSPFSTVTPEGIARKSRAVFPIDFGPTGADAARDVSNNVTADPRFEASPAAVGMARVNGSPLSAGDVVPEGASMVFTLDVGSAGVQKYLRAGVSIGRLNLLVTSMHPASDFGTGPVTYPTYSTRYNPFGNAASIVVNVSLCPANIANDQGTALNNPSRDPSVPDGGVNEGDYNCFFQGFFDASPACDIADDQGGIKGMSPGVPNSGVNEGDYNAFFMYFFDTCG